MERTHNTTQHDQFFCSLYHMVDDCECYIFVLRMTMLLIDNYMNVNRLFCLFCCILSSFPLFRSRWMLLSLCWLPIVVAVQSSSKRCFHVILFKSVAAQHHKQQQQQHPFNFEVCSAKVDAMAISAIEIDYVAHDCALRQVDMRHCGIYLQPIPSPLFPSSCNGAPRTVVLAQQINRRMCLGVHTK